MKNILFVCSGNSCRSQMAEAWGAALSKGRFRVKSAGTAPIGILKATIETMNAAGIDMSLHTSDLLTPDMFVWADYVITLCNHARDNCPVIPPGVIHLHWDISNPDRGYTDDETRRIEFGKTRDEIRRRVEKLYSEIETDNVLSE